MANTSKPRTIRFLSWNVKGIHHPIYIKRTRVFSHLKSLGSQILYLQETHLRSNEHKKLKKGWVDQIFHSNYDNRSRGAAILIRKGVPFVPIKVIPDNNGRYIIRDALRQSSCSGQSIRSKLGWPKFLLYPYEKTPWSQLTLTLSWGRLQLYALARAR